MGENNDANILLFCVNSICINELLNKIIDIYRTELYSYNNIAKRYGLYLKPIHISVKKNKHSVKTYHYYGRYWYRIEYVKGKIVWIYVGKEKPIQEIPDPPLNPFTAIKTSKSGDGETSCIYIDSVYNLRNIHSYFVKALETTNSCTYLDKKTILNRQLK